MTEHITPKVLRHFADFFSPDPAHPCNRAADHIEALQEEIQKLKADLASSQREENATQVRLERALEKRDAALHERDDAKAGLEKVVEELKKAEAEFEKVSVSVQGMKNDTNEMLSVAFSLYQEAQTREQERATARAKFTEWATAGGNPGGNALAAGHPVTKPSLAKVRAMGLASLAEKDVFRIAALLDTMEIAVRSQIKEQSIAAFHVWADEWKHFSGGDPLSWMKPPVFLTEKAVKAAHTLGMRSFSVKEACLAELLLDVLDGVRSETRTQEKAPLPPEVLANALQDRIHPSSGRLLSAKPVVTTQDVEGEKS